jgi:hypothetical protein
VNEAMQVYVTLAVIHGFFLGLIDLLNCGPGADLEDLPYGIVWAVLRGVFWPVAWGYVAWAGLRLWWKTGEFGRPSR